MVRLQEALPQAMDSGRQAQVVQQTGDLIQVQRADARPAVQQHLAQVPAPLERVREIQRIRALQTMWRRGVARVIA